MPRRPPADYPSGMSASGPARADGQLDQRGAEEAGGSQPRVRPSPWSMGWLEFTTLVLSVLGLADSAYQTYTHYSGIGLLGCNANGDACVLVQHSPESIVFGIPVAVLGVAFYLFMVPICSPWAWRSALPVIRRVRLASVAIGMCFVLYLIYAELIEIGRICPYCTSVHIVTFLLFSLIVFQTAMRSPRT
jgi:uncharacterized membrane protein